MSGLVICHTADFHLGPSGTKLDPQTGLNARFLDRGRCAAFAVGDSITRGAGLVLIAGDIFDGCRPTPTQVRCAREIFRPAVVRGIPVVVIKGNHDDVRNLAECHALDLFQELPGLTIVDRPCLLNVWREDDQIPLYVRPACGPLAPKGLVPAQCILQIACIPWPNKQLLLADEENRRLSPTDLNLLVREKMMAVARGLAEQRIEGTPCVLLIHCAFDTAEAGKQNSLAMLSSEWTLNIHEVASLGFDLVCAGHYHRRQVLNEDPWVGYCGSPEACSFAEEADGDKGYFLHEIGLCQ